jgi:UDP-2,3-diacylglucosamine pyrophosphatase LpxH
MGPMGPAKTPMGWDRINNQSHGLLVNGIGFDFYSHGSPMHRSNAELIQYLQDIYTQTNPSIYITGNRNGNEPPE